jgi:hypothetical protein
MFRELLDRNPYTTIDVFCSNPVSSPADITHTLDVCATPPEDEQVVMKKCTGC